MSYSVVIIGPYAPSMFRFRGPLIRDLVQQGVRVYALAPDYDEVWAERIRSLGAIPISMPLNRTGLNPLEEMWSLVYLWRLLIKVHPDVVLGYHSKPVAYGPIAGWLAGVPRRIAWLGGLGYVFTPDAWSRKKWLIRLPVKILYRWSFAIAHWVWVQNPDDREELVRQGLVTPQKTVVVGGTGVDLEVWRPVPPHLEPITFTLVARLLRTKGVYEFVEVARLIKVRFPQTRFWIIGPLETNPGAVTRQEVENWVQQGWVEWKGEVEDVQSFLAQTSVFVLPSYYREGIPRSTQEALAMARPVITTDVPGCRETVVNGENGFLVPPRDVEALAQAVLRFLEEPDRIRRMGEASRRLAEERFDVRRINQTLISYILGYV